MKAVRVHRFGNPPEFVVAETDLPEPAADQVEIQVHAAGINPVDSYVCWGGYEFDQPGLPFTASGGVGLPTVQLAVALGLNVIGTAGTAAGMAAVKASGATAVLNHREPGYLDAIDGTEPDLVIEMLASKNLQTDVELVRRSGRVVIVGSRGPSEVQPRSLMVGEVDVRGTAIWNMTPLETMTATAQIGELIETGQMTPVVGRQFALHEVAAAVECLMSGATIGKVVLIP